jgi:hypothetical protein
MKMKMSIATTYLFEDVDCGDMMVIHHNDGSIDFIGNDDPEHEFYKSIKDFAKDYPGLAAAIIDKAVD